MANGGVTMSATSIVEGIGLVALGIVVFNSAMILSDRCRKLYRWARQRPARTNTGARR